jgi:hypothetical protein
MPWGDGTGPAGLGPMTGRKAGFCAGFRTPGFFRGRPGRACAPPGRRSGRMLACGGLMGLGAALVCSFFPRDGQSKN